MLLFGTNHPFTRDDSIFFIGSYVKRFVLEDNIWDKIAYFFSPSHHPHTKLLGRLQSHLSYVLTGNIQFKWLIMMGSLILLASAALYGKYLNKKPFYYIPFFLMLLVPISNNLWIGPITGYPYMYLLAFIVIYLGVKGNYLLAAIIAFITSFTHSPGIIICFFALMTPLSFDQKLKLNKKLFLFWLSVVAIVIYSFWKLAYSKGGMVESRTVSSIPTNFYEIGSMIRYYYEFVLMPFRIFELHNSLKLLIFCIPLSAMVFWVMSLNKERKVDTTSLLFFLFTAAVPLISAVLSDDKSTLDDVPSPRYEMYAFYFWVGLYVLIQKSMAGSKAIIYASLFIVLFSVRFLHYYKEFPDYASSRNYKWAHKQMNNQAKKFVKGGEFRIFKEGMKNKVFSPQLEYYKKTELTGIDFTKSKLAPKNLIWHQTFKSNGSNLVEFIVNKDADISFIERNIIDNSSFEIKAKKSPLGLVLNSNKTILELKVPKYNDLYAYRYIRHANKKTYDYYLRVEEVLYQLY